MDAIKSRFRIALGIALATTLASAAAQAPATIEQPGRWSAEAVYLWPGDTDIADAPKGPRLAEVWSPDHQHVLSVSDNHLTVRDKVGSALSHPLAIEDLAEVEWSPDSRVFVVTQSNGGLVGTWSTEAYAVTPQGSVQQLDVEHAVTARFQFNHEVCSETPNVGSGGWLNPRVLLVVIEVPPHSSCRDMGHLWGYEVSVIDGRILQVYDDLQLRRKYIHRLGRRFIRID
jgi:hypothetical protein